jgi:very-short-patch-repair endonuclease
VGRYLTKALPLDGGGLGGGDVSRRKIRDMKKHPVDGAHARARTLRQNMTQAERRVWQILRSHRMTGYQFLRQVPIGRYIADFVCHEARLIVEIDGGQHDRSSPREAERSGFLQNQGYRILRFWSNEVLANLDVVHETIAEELDCITPTQTLPHRGGRAPRREQHSY